MMGGFAFFIVVLIGLGVEYWDQGGGWAFFLGVFLIVCTIIWAIQTFRNYCDRMRILDERIANKRKAERLELLEKKTAVPIEKLIARAEKRAERQFKQDYALEEEMI